MKLHQGCKPLVFVKLKNTIMEKKTFEASYKKGLGPGELKWVECEAKNENEAMDKLNAFVAGRHPGYRLYGGPSIKKQPLK